MRSRALAVAAAALALGLAACGSSPPAPSGSDGTIDVYSSLPTRGPQGEHAAALRDGIALALREAHGGAGHLRVRYVALDDSLPNTDGWDPGQTARNASRVAQDKHALLYIGDLDSGASAVSMPILNKAGIAQISPASTYTGLTTDGVGSELGEPEKYIPSNRRTFLRVVPRDAVQAGALLALMGGQGCVNVAVAHDRDAYGEGLARLVKAQAALAPQVVDVQGLDPNATTYAPYALALSRLGVDCVLSTAPTPPRTGRLLAAVARALPHARLYASSSACAPQIADRALGGLPRGALRRFRCTAVPLAPRAYPGAAAFAAAYRAAYGRPLTDAWALYGYEAMRLGLDTIRGLGSYGDSPDALLDALFKVRHRPSPLGTYSIDANGDTSLRRFGVYRVTSHGAFVFDRPIAGEAGPAARGSG